MPNNNILYYLRAARTKYKNKTKQKRKYNLVKYSKSVDAKRVFARFLHVVDFHLRPHMHIANVCVGLCVCECELQIMQCLSCASMQFCFLFFITYVSHQKANSFISYNDAVNTEQFMDFCVVFFSFVLLLLLLSSSLLFAVAFYFGLNNSAGACSKCTGKLYRSC